MPCLLLNIEPAGDSSVLLTLGSGQPYNEQLRRTVSGRDLQTLFYVHVT